MMTEISNPLSLKLQHFALAKNKTKKQNYIRFKQVAEWIDTYFFSPPQSIAVALRSHLFS